MAVTEVWYDVSPQAAALCVLAGPPGMAGFLRGWLAAMDGNLDGIEEHGFRWLTDAEWSAGHESHEIHSLNDERKEQS